MLLSTFLQNCLIFVRGIMVNYMDHAANEAFPVCMLIGYLCNVPQILQQLLAAHEQGKGGGGPKLAQGTIPSLATIQDPAQRQAMVLKAFLEQSAS